MLYRGESVSDIKNHLGHDNVQSSTLYLHLDLKRKRQAQDRFVQHMQSVLLDDHKIDELLQTENKGDLMAWLDSL
jgi:integrase/recombinase XerD